MTTKLNASKVKQDDLMAFVYYVKVKSANPNELIVADLDNENSELSIRGKELIERSFSADQYETEEKVTKTACAEKLVHSLNKPLTVCFDKADGVERILRGRMIKPEPLLGRSMCEDLDVQDKHRQRLVDHRTIKWLIVDGIKFIVK